MKHLISMLLLLVVLHAAVRADVARSIFDDDWTPPPARQPVRPPTTAPPVTPGPATNPPATPKPLTPAPASPAPVVALQPARIAVPTAAAQADAWKLIKEDLYKDDIARAKTPAARAGYVSTKRALRRDAF